MSDLRELLRAEAAKYTPDELSPYDDVRRVASRRRHWRERVAVLAVATVVTGGFAGVAVSRHSDPQYVLHGVHGPTARPAETDCGTVFQQRPDVSPITVRAWSCLVAAAGNKAPGRLRVVQTTTEGDPVFVTYSTNGDGSVTVLTDTRLDAFGGKQVSTEVCRQPDPKARGMFSGCSSSMPASHVSPVADVFCGFALRRHLISAQLTTLAAVRETNIGGPPPGVRPGKSLFPSRPGSMRAAWCWTDSAGASGASPGPTWTLYVALATGESARFVSTQAGTTPPTGPPSFP